MLPLHHRASFGADSGIRTHDRMLASDKLIPMKLGAGEGTRTLDLLLGKQLLYQLSYTRITLEASLALLDLFLYLPRQEMAFGYDNLDK